MSDGVRPELGQVPETALWTLWYRALEARRPDTVLHDRVAVELVERIDFPFAEKFGQQALVGQLQALRTACFDREVEDFLTRYPRGTVVGLGGGLETQAWRVDNGRADWLTVDLPETARLREHLLPPDERHRILASSATDPRWMAEVDPARGVLINTEGLLMYLHPGEVRSLIAACAERFPGGTLVLDAVPRWFSRRSLEGRVRDRYYQAPPMPFGMDADERGKLAGAHPAITGVREVYPEGARGLLRALLPVARRIKQRPSVVALRFAEAWRNPGRPGTMARGRTS
ncbi:class I SAM-dependent methyltransferase [Streptomyces sp. FH025]|uniref:class I SAM-dependent methyltransferase n=1 Tax=Streptomyces sp. FH025 TaxID=2815937 RepID=UPI001A9DBE5B|nr:class I SAM-dependent methyltransferase [Streptomyces sp. FH025]MBO1416281.1 class I SAM-dependent methyltransferase [Streptomyces sp. FH025]